MREGYPKIIIHSSVTWPHDKILLTTILLNKPYGILSQFSPIEGSRWGCLADLLRVPGVYPLGRLDADSEGLLVLTSNGQLQARLSQPKWGHWRTYQVQVEGIPTEEQLNRLREGVVIRERVTKRSIVNRLESSPWPERHPPIRYRQFIPTSWIEVSLQEGRNRQVRRMTASVGLPTLRLIRVKLDLLDGRPPLNLENLEFGQWRTATEDESRRLAEIANQPRTSSS